MNRTGILVFGALLSAKATLALAQDADEYVEFNTTWSESSSCNLDIATRVELTALAQDSERWNGQCVAVRGYRGSRALFADPAEASSNGSDWAAGLEDRRIGLYGQNGVSGLLSNFDDGSSLAVGQVGLCENLWTQYDFVRGYCHSAGGAFIALSYSDPSD